MMQSAIYHGWLRHRRYFPKKHEFNYRVFMVYFSTAELSQVLTLSPFWSDKKWAPARFKRADFHGDPKSELDEAIRRTVEKELDWVPKGDVRVLANFRYFGVNMNPLTTYYCFDESGQHIEAIVAEVNNTPWNERRAYVLDCRDSKEKHDVVLEKDFTVSPFNDLDIQYHWRSTIPSDKLTINIDCLREEGKVLDATLVLEKEELSARSLNRVLLRFPFMTLKVVTLIYWEALRLFLKGVPFLGKTTKKTAKNLESKAELKRYEVH